MVGSCQFTLPTGDNVQLIYGAQHPSPGTNYLQGVRSHAYDERSDEAKTYRALVWMYCRNLSAAVVQEFASVDAIVSPPSSREDAEPYRAAIKEHCSCALDLTAAFTRKGEKRAGDPDTTVEDMIGEIDYEPNGQEEDIGSLLIVDESISSGKTAAAILAHLRMAKFSEECQVTIAVWAKLSRRVAPK